MQRLVLVRGFFEVYSAPWGEQTVLDFVAVER